MKGFVIFDTNIEKEKRFVVKRKTVTDALAGGLIKIKDLKIIRQAWIITDSENRYTGRIRETVSDNKTFYEHTVKHRVYKNGSKGDLEVTTEIDKDTFELLLRKYKNVPLQSKKRFYINDHTGDYGKYIITVDFPDNNADNAYVEYELKDGEKDINNFIKPSWLV